MKTFTVRTLTLCWIAVLLLAVFYPNFIFGSHWMKIPTAAFANRFFGVMVSYIALTFLLKKDSKRVFGALLLGLCFSGTITMGGIMADFSETIFIGIPLWTIGSLSLATMILLLSYYPQRTWL